MSELVTFWAAEVWRSKDLYGMFQLVLRTHLAKDQRLDSKFEPFRLSISVLPSDSVFLNNLCNTLQTHYFEIFVVHSLKRIVNY